MSEYRKNWVSYILGNRSVVQVALDVHMTTTGSFDRPKHEQERDLIALMDVEDTWDNHHACEFDDKVLELIRASIVEAGYATRRETYKGDGKHEC